VTGGARSERSDSDAGAAGAAGAAASLAAVILAGGKSRRMGAEKALLEARGVTLIERLARGLAPSSRRLLVSVGRGGPSPGLVRALERAREASGRELAVVEDEREDGGPLEGVRAALARLEARAAFFIAVDLPGVPPALVGLLAERSAAPGALGAVPAWSRGIEPACAVYDRRLLPAIERALDHGERSLREIALLPRVARVELEGPEAARVFGALAPAARRRALENAFSNINTPEDYREYVARFGEPGAAER
jgi:molybdopterin-guanine dinucleotide biosynthesis protein A